MTTKWWRLRPALLGGALRKIGEDVSETLELPRQWKVIQHVHEKFSCRSCESITQPPASSHPISARARPERGCSPMCCSPNTACICRINRQCAAYAREGIDL